MFSKLLIYISCFIIITSGIVLSKELNTKYINLYIFSEKVFYSKEDNNSFDYSSPHNIFQDENKYIYTYTHLTLDFKRKRYQINQLNTYNGNGQIVLVSQGNFTIQNEEIKLIDKNNKIVFKGLYTKDSILFIAGIKYLCKKTFKNQGILSGIPYGLIEFLDWDNNYKKQVIKNNNINQISIGYYSSESMIYMKLSEKEYEIYCSAGNSITYEISKGSWQLIDGKVILKDYDNINKLELFIKSKNILIPNFRLPFAYEITPLTTR